MSGASAIEWTEVTWNPVTGCDRISAGCENCYALTLARRLQAMGSPRYQRDGWPATSGPGFAVTLHPDLIDLPKRWRRPRVVFVNSMSDLFHAKVPRAFLEAVFATIAATPQHTYQVLTKRSTRLRRLAPDLEWPGNLWMGVSVENAEHHRRVEDLAVVPAAVRFVSAEPLLGSLVGIDLTAVDWLIAGGESGPRHRPVDPAWVRELREASVAAGTGFFFKQWGGRSPKAGGRVLDGVTWDQRPAPRAASRPVSGTGMSVPACTPPDQSGEDRSRIESYS